MLALRSERRIDGIDSAWPEDSATHDADWLPLQQAACELGISPGTARRMIRRGQLRNRMVARPGGYAYLVYLPNSWHAQFARHAQRPAADESSSGWLKARLLRLEEECLRLSRMVRHAVRPPSPAGRLMVVEAGGPFARYRWLARRRRWWRF